LLTVQIFHPTMATLDDKLLGEKLHYYCSSSEDEGEEEPAPAPAPTPGPGGGGDGPNTGPKGVLKDWQRYKQLETEQREAAELERLALAQKLSLTCRTEQQDQQAREQEAAVDRELEELLDDGFLESYMQKRMEEMVAATQNLTKRFGQVVELHTGESFLDCVDREEKRVTVVVLVHEPSVEGCTAMAGCIECLAQQFPTVKFCKILSSAAMLSKHFKVAGVPALLVYRAGNLLGSFIRVTDQLGTDFFASDVESFLAEHGMLPDKDAVPSIIRGPAVVPAEDEED